MYSRDCPLDQNHRNFSEHLQNSAGEYAFILKLPHRHHITEISSSILSTQNPRDGPRLRRPRALRNRLNIRHLSIKLLSGGRSSLFVVLAGQLAAYVDARRGTEDGFHVCDVLSVRAVDAGGKANERTFESFAFGFWHEEVGPVMTVVLESVHDVVRYADCATYAKTLVTCTATMSE